MYKSKYTGAQIDALLDKLNSNDYATVSVVAQMIKAAFGDNEGNETPEEPETPEVSNSIGTINNNNEIVINEELLTPGTYTLKYIDSSDKAIDNFKPISEFTIS